jgi:hypothetical protein
MPVAVKQNVLLDKKEAITLNDWLYKNFQLAFSNELLPMLERVVEKIHPGGFPDFCARLIGYYKQKKPDEAKNELEEFNKIFPKNKQLGEKESAVKFIKFFAKQHPKEFTMLIVEYLEDSFKQVNKNE